MPRNLQYGIVNVEACGWRRVSQLDGGTISWVCMAASTAVRSTTLQNEKKRTYVRTTRAVLPPKIPALWSERTRSDISRVFSMNYRRISVRQVLCGNYFIYTLSYIFYSPLMLRHRADGGIAKYCILRYTWFRRQKHVTSSTCRHGLERSRVKSSPTNIPLYLWYILWKKRTPPCNIELVTTWRNPFLIYKLYAIVNDKIVPLQERGGLGNDCWEVPVGYS